MRLKGVIIKFAIILSITIIFNEFLIYYFTLIWCNWPPELEISNNVEPVRVMLLADTHLLGPYKGHWFDKLRREWQMHRTFQTAMTLFKPEVVFVLGDLFDEGEWVNQRQFYEYVERFEKLFRTPEGTILHSIVGNHDVGFHYKLRKPILQRFSNTFNLTRTGLISIRGIHFVRINSMTMHGDGCEFCKITEDELSKIAKQLNCFEGSEYANDNDCKNVDNYDVYSEPILLQHFPTYRKSDNDCIERDTLKIEQFRERWEVLSLNATRWLGKLLRPRVIFSGHSHDYCKLRNKLHIMEYTLSSFNWRNKNNPSFILATFTTTDYSVSLCPIPHESTVLFCYILCPMLCFILLYLLRMRCFRGRKYKK